MKPIKGAMDPKCLPLHKKLAMGLPVNKPMHAKGPKTPA